ncbi:MAG: RNA polymerase sigma factor [Proteobacteria bacterium]|nr:RNA polymerase sigma factor [Pseudomonadota bacterium]MBU1139739.1 RNA polymerase sigma factor [Pseudomonadota bacterium]
MSERYRKFYDEYKHKLFSYLMYKSGDYEASKDIMQESFTRHFQHYGHDAVISPALLFTIARNALVDHQRQNKKFCIAEDAIPQVAADQENSFIAKEETDRIYNAMNRLPEEDRDILSLAVGGLVYKEIAATFGLSLANVKVRVHRARNKLRQMMKDEVE